MQYSLCIQLLNIHGFRYIFRIDRSLLLAFLEKLPHSYALVGLYHHFTCYLNLILLFIALDQFIKVVHSYLREEPQTGSIPTKLRNVTSVKCGINPFSIVVFKIWVLISSI